MVFSSIQRAKVFVINIWTQSNRIIVSTRQSGSWLKTGTFTSLEIMIFSNKKVAESS